jgi:hypothetical protein
MVDAEHRERVLRMIAQSDRAGQHRKEGGL